MIQLGEPGLCQRLDCPPKHQTGGPRLHRLWVKQLVDDNHQGFLEAVDHLKSWKSVFKNG